MSRDLLSQLDAAVVEFLVPIQSYVLVHLTMGPRMLSSGIILNDRKPIPLKSMRVKNKRLVYEKFNGLRQDREPWMKLRVWRRT